MDYRTFDVYTDVNACGCTWGVYGKFALNVDSGRKIPYRNRAIEPASAACWSDALTS